MSLDHLGGKSANPFISVYVTSYLGTRPRSLHGVHRHHRPDRGLREQVGAGDRSPGMASSTGAWNPVARRCTCSSSTVYRIGGAAPVSDAAWDVPERAPVQLRGSRGCTDAQGPTCRRGLGGGPQAGDLAVPVRTRPDPPTEGRAGRPRTSLSECGPGLWRRLCCRAWIASGSPSSGLAGAPSSTCGSPGHSPRCSRSPASRRAMRNGRRSISHDWAVPGLPDHGRAAGRHARVRGRIGALGQ